MEAKELVERLEKFPGLKARFEELLAIAENQDGKIELADTAEEMIVLTSRSLNREALQSWAENQSQAQSSRFEKHHLSANKEVKKKSNGTVRSAK